ncbi:MBL fold metallo-hydrolase [Streptomyces sp. VNUA116]|uniref:MBL fold metallo-hydrolase n=1 Tax=Streptomyces sp. VNUA116 TaxID=3062449 RepID=UPI00267747AB|nr:MBL fold metallo-hydrolase [Streptomyces sp. VNUA116]WKU47891.1 MBL fold metallo-hydrolase [Streptomyces sp. VNUA116]
MTGFRLSSSPLDALRPAAFGADPSGERMARIRRSPHFADGVFTNPVGAQRTPSGAMLKFLPTYFRAEERARRAPAGTVPVHPTTVADLAVPAASGLRLTWMGHSSVLAEIDGARVLFDPVWSERCSPFAFAGPKRLHPVPVPLRETGPLDAVVISHDHYDHLDMPTVRALARGTGARFVVPLGVGAHLEHWGVSADRITELDWHEQADVAGLTFTATPARHFCGRALRNTQHTLWASWVVTGPAHRVFHSGDTGYFPGFKDIGAQYGPFDATMVQIGAYSEFWPDIHMTPEEGLQAHADLQGDAAHGIFLPIHWGTFNLAPHPWEEPAEGSVTAGRRRGARVATPRPGQPFEPADGAGLPTDPWWRAVAARPAGQPAAPAEQVEPEGVPEVSLRA